MSNATIFVVERPLSDGSFVYDVRMRETVLHAITENDAEELATAIRLAINRHTTEIADIKYETVT